MFVPRQTGEQIDANRAVRHRHPADLDGLADMGSLAKLFGDVTNSSGGNRSDLFLIFRCIARNMGLVKGKRRCASSAINLKRAFQHWLHALVVGLGSVVGRIHVERLVRLGMTQDALRLIADESRAVRAVR